MASNFDNSDSDLRTESESAFHSDYIPDKYEIITLSDSSDEMAPHENNSQSEDSDQEPFVMLVQSPLPNSKHPKRLVFSRRVNEVREKILRRRQICASDQDLRNLYKQIDGWISQANNSGEDIIALRLQLDKSMVAYFGNDIDFALKLLNSANKHLNILAENNCTGSYELLLVCKFALSSLYNKKGKVNKALDELKSLEIQIQGSEQSEDYFRLNYNRGTSYLAQVRLAPKKKNIYAICKTGVSAFENSRTAIQDGESKGQVYQKRDHFFGLFMAVKLDLILPEYKTKRAIPVVDVDTFERAQDRLRMILTDYSVTEMQLRFKLRLFITLGGLFYRRGAINRNEIDMSARQELMDAWLIMECAGIISAESPYEERTLIEDMLQDLAKKVDRCAINTTKLYKKLDRSELRNDQGGKLKKSAIKKVKLYTKSQRMAKRSVTYDDSSSSSDEESLLSIREFAKLNSFFSVESLCNAYKPCATNIDDNLDVTTLLSLAKNALDHPYHEEGQNRFKVSLNDVMFADKCIKLIKETIQYKTPVTFIVELLLAMTAYYFRAAQVAQTQKCKSKCKFGLNLAILYSELNLAYCAEHIRDERKMKEVRSFTKFLRNVSMCFDEGHNPNGLFPDRTYE